LMKQRFNGRRKKNPLALTRAGCVSGTTTNFDAFY
jgi:hypothetical protein